MGYRLPDERGHLDDVASRCVINVDNGVLSRFAIPCYYHKGRPWSPRMHRMVHDHFGWPSPDNADKSCQLPSTRCRWLPVVEGIDLEGEGYSSILVSMTDPPDGLSFGGAIDGNVVKLTITSLCEDAVEKDLDIPFCVYALSENAPIVSDETEQESSETSSDTSENDPNASYDNEHIRTTTLRDIVIKGTLHIVAGPIR